MPGSQLHVHLYRDSFKMPWGFRLQGGKDLNQELTVQRVFSNSPAEGELQRGDVILAIGGQATNALKHKDAQDAIKNAGGQINLVVHRPTPGTVHISPLSPPIVTQRPRAPAIQQPPSMPSRSSYGAPQPAKWSDFGSDYGRTPAQRYEPVTKQGAMLNRVQSSLDNITLSPRTPEPAYGGPFYQSPPQQQQQPAKFFTPTSLLLEQQKMEEERQRQAQQPQYQPQPQYHIQPQYHAPPPPPQQQQQQQDGAEEGEDEPIVPVWERRKQFQEAPSKQKAAVRTPRGNPVPKVSRPAPANTSYTDLGTSYRPPPQQNKPQQSSAVWQPSPKPKPKPVAAPVPAKPQVIHFSSAPAGPAPGSIQSPVKSAPPVWKRTQDSDDETDSTPAWRNTLRSTGVKPWDVDLDYHQEEHQQNAQRGSPQPQSQPQNQNQNQQGQGLPGGRDWSQSQVFQFIQQDSNKKSKGKAGPAPAPKPHAALRQFDQQPQQQQQRKHQPPPPQPKPQQQQQSHYHDDMEISDF